MSIIKFIESFTDESLMHNTVSRRNSLSHFTNIGKKGALAAIPGGLLTLLLMPQKGKATTFAPVDDSTITQALQLALTLEYLDSEFYQMGLDTNLIPQGRDRDAFTKIVLNENEHKATLIAALGGNSSPNFIAPPNFDYTAGGLFDPFNNYDQFLAMAQAFEDTGVRAYKGQAHNLMSNPDLLQTALQIHSAESRQASEVRRLRGEKGWITGNQRGTNVDVALQPVYNGEEMTTQRGFNTSTVNNGSLGPAIPSTAGSESFDEPLTRAQVMAIANMFIEP
jgi:hypothetical protein